MPHLQTLAMRTQQLWDAGALRAGERATLCEALVVAAAAGPPDVQAQVPLLPTFLPSFPPFFTHGYQPSDLATPNIPRVVFSQLGQYV